MGLFVLSQPRIYAAWGWICVEIVHEYRIRSWYFFSYLTVATKECKLRPRLGSASTFLILIQPSRRANGGYEFVQYSRSAECIDLNGMCRCRLFGFEDILLYIWELVLAHVLDDGNKFPSILI